VNVKSSELAARQIEAVSSSLRSRNHHAARSGVLVLTGVERHRRVFVLRE